MRRINGKHIANIMPIKLLKRWELTSCNTDYLAKPSVRDLYKSFLPSTLRTYLASIPFVVNSGEDRNKVF